MKKTILVIEDEKVTRNNLLQFLDSEGFNTIGAENGNIGIQLASNNIPDLIICDILMPEMDGYDVLFHLEQHPDTKGIPFIFLTVTNEQDVLAKNESLSQDDYLQKPITSERLREAIKNKLNNMSTVLEESSLEEQLRLQFQQLEEYSQMKDLLFASLCEKLKVYLPSLNLEIKKLKNLQPSSEQSNSINKIQQDFVSILSIINQVSELQDIINIDNYKLLEQFTISQPSNISKEESDTSF